MKSPVAIVSAFALTFCTLSSCLSQDTAKAESSVASDTTVKQDVASNEPTPSTMLDTAQYNERLEHMLNGDSSGKWPVKYGLSVTWRHTSLQNDIAFYGNLYSKQMGILGELPRKQMLEKLQAKWQQWKKADSTLDIQPALHYIAVTAQIAPGKAESIG